MALLKVLEADGTEHEIGGTSDADAIHDNVAGEIAAVAEKVTPVSADLLVIEDSAASNAKKRVQVGNLPGSAGDVSAAANLTDNAIVRGDGGAKGVQDSTATISDAGVMSVPGNIDTPELANTSGDLKIEPDAEGNVTFFEDTDVADAAAGRSLFIYRKALEGDDSLRLYVANDGDAVIDASDTLTLISAVGKVLWLLSGDAVILGLGDDAGADKVEVQDVNLNVVGAWDSNGNITLDGTVDGRDVAADGVTLDGMEAFAIAMAVALG